jgi:ABC-type glycerol-3-phosphate transport system substrate-binding protein
VNPLQVARVARRSATALLVLALALPACGGGDDEEEAAQTVRDFVEATRERDSDKFCEELTTEEFLEQTTGAQGDQARDACKDQLESIRGVNVQLVRIKKTEIDGDEAEVTATLTTQGQTGDRILRLEKEDGDWRLAGGGQ